MNNIITIILLFFYANIFAQETVDIPKFLKNPMDSITEQNFNQSLESLFSEIAKGKINEKLLTIKRLDLTKSQLQKLVNYEMRKDSIIAKIKDKQLINVYPVSNNEYFISISYTNYKSNSILICIINLIATEMNGEFTFSIPLDYLTRYWKKYSIGNITYHYRDEINKERAKLFDKKNTIIARKLGVKPENLDFYMTDNFQEISKLLSFGYSLNSNGEYREGYGVNSKTIFAVMNNEDFSHDIFHYYSGQINKSENRNWIAEEGIAYSWGNAYYTSKNGKTITNKELIEELQNHLIKNPNTNLFSLFMSNEKIFTNIAPEISIRSVISGIIAKQVEKEKDIEGILKLINAGSENMLNNYLKAISQLIGITKDNFNLKVRKLIMKN